MMQSIWAPTIKTGDIIKIPQGCYMWYEADVKMTAGPTYGLFIDKNEQDSCCKIMIDGKYYFTYSDNIYPGSKNG